MQEQLTPEEKQELINKREENIKKNLDKIRHKIVIISGKGGVGKTTVSVNLAISLASMGYKTGILDVDITGPNVAKMLGIDPTLKPKVDPDQNRFYPIIGPINLKVMSMAFLIPNQDSPVVWRGPIKMTAVRQFLGEAEWGDLDFLICDLPPGTSDETLDILQLIPDENVIVVTTPQEVALMDARKTISMAQKMDRKLLGIVENMSGFKCSKCGYTIDIFGSGGAEKAARDFEVELLGKIPFETEIGQQGDIGLPFTLKYPDSESSQNFKKITSRIIEILDKGNGNRV
ncbi:MAG: Mrp/NBP35 family ATP-binding protein [Candidatus Lokiarchaeota archaeon]|nr:Mrp/NBP35 family ATP-binding protein [Candidatus Lokiarchaeota archaeon]